MPTSKSPPPGFVRPSRSCTVAGCRSPVRSPYSPYCSGHRRTLGRHGHPLQTAIKAPEIAPLLKLIAQRQAENPDNKAFAILRDRWGAMVASARATVAAMDAGEAYSRLTVRAASLLIGVAETAAADAVVRTALAMVMHAQANPGRYRCDTAVRFELAKKVLRLAPSSCGRTWDHKARVTRTRHRDIPPKVLQRIAAALMEAFAGPGAQLHAIEQARLPPEEVERRQVIEGLNSLKA